LGYGRIVAVLILFGAAGAQTVVVHPKLIHDVLVNPGMGIQAFQRFNGDSLNAGEMVRGGSHRIAGRERKRG
jgi:hypothetical protein